MPASGSCQIRSAGRDETSEIRDQRAGGVYRLARTGQDKFMSVQKLLVRFAVFCVGYDSSTSTFRAWKCGGDAARPCVAGSLPSIDARRRRRCRQVGRVVTGLKRACHTLPSSTDRARSPKSRFRIRGKTVAGRRDRIFVAHGRPVRRSIYPWTLSFLFGNLKSKAVKQHSKRAGRRSSTYHESRNAM